MTEQPPRIDKHEAWDRAGKTALRAAHDLGAALSEDGETGAEPVVFRPGGPHRSIAAVAALIDDALAEQEDPETEGSRQPDRPPQVSS